MDSATPPPRPPSVFIVAAVGHCGTSIQMVVIVLIVIVGGWVNQGVVDFHIVLPSAFSVDEKCSPPCCGGPSTPGV